MARLLCSLALAAILAGCGGGTHRPRLVIGAVEDAAKGGDPRGQMQLARSSGFGAVALSAVWSRGERTPAPGDLASLGRATDAAAAEQVRPIVALYQFSSNTPLTDADRADFAAYAAALVRGLPAVHDLIVGNEPNLNLFWMPQYDAAGNDAAAPAFEALLAETYDAVKNARKDVDVIGGGLAPRGSDDPGASRPTHSPTEFIRDLSSAYRASHRDGPIMDAFDIHPYGENVRIPPSFEHPRTTSIGIADYAKLTALLRPAFGDLPIVYGEYGVETAIPPAKQALYNGTEVIQTTDEGTQGRYYTQAIALAACQPQVELLLFFHVQDEPNLAGLQSGVRYADGSPKSDLGTFRRAAQDPTCQAK